VCRSNVLHYLVPCLYVVEVLDVKKVINYYVIMHNMIIESEREELVLDDKNILSSATPCQI
jgi:hypothetical protein